MNSACVHFSWIKKPGKVLQPPASDSEADRPKWMTEEEGSDDTRQRKQHDAVASTCIFVLMRNRSYAVLLDMLCCMPSYVSIGL